MAADVLYISFDGLLQPLAFSQVVRVVTGLAERGLRYHVLSIERPADLEKVELRRFVSDKLHSAGVGWTPLAAASMGSARLAMRAAAQMALQASRIARRERIRLIHARGYHGAVVASALKRLLDLPYIFDARGYWIEERSGPGGWFSSSTSYVAGKLVEQMLFRGAAAVVTLTELQANDLAAGLFGPAPPLLEVIPTCADYSAFFLRDSRPTKPDNDEVVPRAVQSRLLGKQVISIVGALNASYYVKEALAFAKLATQVSSTAHLLILSRQQREYETALRLIGVPPDRYTLAEAEHWVMPYWLQWIDWGLLLLPETAAKRASMPTKLAEFFAAGVRPVFYGCNSEAARWVERAGSGYVLTSIEPAALKYAADNVSHSVTDQTRLRTAREITMPHFGLVSCIGRYARLVGTCLSSRVVAGSRSLVNVQRHNGSLNLSEEGRLAASGHIPPPSGTSSTRSPG
jgi:hypothetical protein